MKKLLFILMFNIFHFNIHSQTEPENSVLMEQIIEQNAGSGDDEVDLSELTTVLTELLRHPVNINKADAEELRESGLFTEFHVLQLFQHKENFGNLLAVHELQVINGYHEDFIRQIQPYITTGRLIDEPNASFGRMLEEGRHQIISRIQWVPEKRKGFKEDIYMGSPLSIYTRYRFNFMKKMSWGIVADKDAGEQFFKGTQKQGFDFYSGHFALRQIGPFNCIVVGDFQLEYGQGLTLWTGMSGGKSPDPSMICKNAQGIRPYTSSNEVFFKRGVALSAQIKKITIDGFFSLRKLDGNREASNDSLDVYESFTSLQESGYHRTENEIADKNSIKEFMFGGHVKYRSKNYRIGITAHQARFNLPFIKNLQPYNRFDFVGSVITNGGMDYSFLIRNIQIFGEAAISGNGAIALVNGLIMSLDPRLTVSILHRNYPRNFNTLYSAAFKESGNNYNEQGIYGGLSFRPVRVLNITCNYDWFYFPWLRYRTDAPSGGYEFSTLISYKPSRKAELYMRYRESVKMINSSEDIYPAKYLVPVRQNGIRFHLTMKVSKSFTLRSRLESVNFRKENTNEKGFMIFQDVQFHPMGFPVSFNFRYALFDSNSYDSRIYAYENDVLYGYSIPAMYHKGSRFYFNTRIKIRKGIDMWLRYAATYYSNRSMIGSGMDEIEGSRKSEIKIQVRMEF